MCAPPSKVRCVSVNESYIQVPNVLATGSGLNLEVLLLRRMFSLF